jgi:hypothetical protein
LIKSRRMWWAGHVAGMGGGRYMQCSGGEVWGKVSTWKA